MERKIINCTINSTTAIFIARDGEKFESEEQCIKYENAQRTLADIKYSRLVRGSVSEFDLFDAGCEDYEYDIVKVDSLQDLQVLINAYLWNGHIKSEEELAKVKENLKTEEIYFVYRGYGGDSFGDGKPLTKENIIAPIISEIDKAISKAGLSDNKKE